MGASPTEGKASGGDRGWREAMIAGLLVGQRADGGFGVHPYSKWTGAHWRLVSLVELGIERTDPQAHAAADHVLNWIASPSRRPTVIAGRGRRHASIEGNALAVSCRLGMAGDPRARRLVDILLACQWPDGGWNCDSNPAAHHSSFHESLAPIWGLLEYHHATRDREALDAARRAGELLLDHRLYRSTASGQPIHPEWLHIHWPHYWHYDFFHGLRAVASVGMLGDPRTEDARARLRSLRRPDGSWRTSGRRWWRAAGSAAGAEVVDWGDAHEVVTAAAFRLLSAA